MLQKIISGGQRGADRAGLEAARYLGLQTGGTAPKGYRVCLPNGEDEYDVELKDYGLVEHELPAYPPRTKLNVENSDGTVWFGYDKSPGGRLTIDHCNKTGKPCIINPTPVELLKWCAWHQITVLNVTGNRESKDNPNIFFLTYRTIIQAFETNEKHS